MSKPIAVNVPYRCPYLYYFRLTISVLNPRPVFRRTSPVASGTYSRPNTVQVRINWVRRYNTALQLFYQLRVQCRYRYCEAGCWVGISAGRMNWGWGDTTVGIILQLLHQLQLRFINCVYYRGRSSRTTGTAVPRAALPYYTAFSKMPFSSCQLWAKTQNNSI
jgi:hypothetical protein